MPTYSYKCDACGHEFDKEQRITEKPVKKCPKCAKMKARRMISLEGPGFILKGGGWESDLYSGPSNTADAKKKKPASADSPSTAESKKDSKTESTSKPESKTKTTSTSTSTSDD